MNDLDEFLEVAAAILVAVVGLMILLTYLEQTLDADPKPRTQTRRSGVAATVRAWVRSRRRG